MAKAYRQLRPLTVSELSVVERRHEPHDRDGFTWCSRDFDEFWPCDAARLLASFGEAVLSGAVAEYRETQRQARREVPSRPAARASDLTVPS